MISPDINPDAGRQGFDGTATSSVRIALAWAKSYAVSLPASSIPDDRVIESTGEEY